MIIADVEKLYPSAQKLVADSAASRVQAKDATLYSFSAEAQQCCENFMGWTDLASNPPVEVAKIQAWAQEQIENGLKYVVLIGQGGSTQAPMTITKYNAPDDTRVIFRTLDSDSPIRVRGIMNEVDLEHTLIITASKSGGTIEPRLALRAVRAIMAQTMPEEEIVKHLVAITDPGSNLEKQAQEEGWAAIFSGEPTVGGRFSALSVFGLVPAALVGLDIQAFVDRARVAEQRCSADSLDNPALDLAAFLYDNCMKGRNKFAFVTPQRGRVLGLWIEQLVAESVGKEGKGILPFLEPDTLRLSKDAGDRTAIVYRTKNDSADELENFEIGLSYIDPAIPRLDYRIDAVEDLAEHFIMWEYATALCGYLLQICPFDQPDVASSKAAVLEILKNGHPAPDFTDDNLVGVKVGTIECRVAPQYKECATVQEALNALIADIKPGDYFAMNAFLPFDGEGRGRALEAVRHAVAGFTGVAACLEIGPRYLHSIGQLQKGGTNNGVFLIVSADESDDIPLQQEVESMGTLAKAQAEGDLVTLAARGRRCVHVHLPNNAAATLRALSEAVVAALVARRK